MGHVWNKDFAWWKAKQFTKLLKICYSYHVEIWVEMLFEINDASF